MVVVGERFYLLLHPRPVYVIGSGRFGEEINFMSASWVSPVSEEPPRVIVAVDKEAYTHELISRWMEFTVNILGIDRIDDIYFFGSTTGREVDKAAARGYRVSKGRFVGAPVLEGVLGWIECRVSVKVDSGDTTLFIGDVVYAEADDRFYDERRGWNYRSVTIPLHNWGRAFLATGRMYFARKT